MNTYNNIRVKYNSIGVKYLSTSTHKKHIKNADMLSKSTEYYNSIKIANTYTKTLYVKYNNKFIKLSSLKTILFKDRKKYIISSDYKYITIFDNNLNYATYSIIKTNNCIIKNNTKDKQQAKRLYNY